MSQVTASHRATILPEPENGLIADLIVAMFKEVMPAQRHQQKGHLGRIWDECT